LVVEDEEEEGEEDEVYRCCDCLAGDEGLAWFWKRRGMG
jgi:hypothetical protein